MPEMGFCLLPIGKLHKRTEKSRLKNFPAGYVGSFYRKLPDKLDNFLGSDFYGRIANDSNIPTEDVQKYILTTSNFSKGIQTEIDHYVARDRINNDSFRQKLDPISKNIVRRQNPLELVFENISTFDTENSIVTSLLKELDVGRKDVASYLVKKAPGPPGINIAFRNRLDKLRNRQKPNENNNNFSPPPSLPALPLPPSGPLFPPSQLPPPPTSSIPPIFISPPPGRFLDPFQPQ